MMDQKTAVITLRLTGEERELIRQRAKKVRMSESGYIRHVVLAKEEDPMPEDLKEILREYLMTNIAIGKDINLIARHYAKGKPPEDYDYARLLSYLKQLNLDYQELTRETLKRIETWKSQNDCESNKSVKNDLNLTCARDTGTDDKEVTDE